MEGNPVLTVVIMIWLLLSSPLSQTRPCHHTCGVLITTCELEAESIHHCIHDIPGEATKADLEEYMIEIREDVENEETHKDDIDEVGEFSSIETIRNSQKPVEGRYKKFSQNVLCIYM